MGKKDTFDYLVNQFLLACLSGIIVGILIFPTIWLYDQTALIFDPELLMRVPDPHESIRVAVFAGLMGAFTQSLLNRIDK